MTGGFRLLESRFYYTQRNEEAFFIPANATINCFFPCAKT